MHLLGHWLLRIKKNCLAARPVPAHSSLDVFWWPRYWHTLKTQPQPPTHPLYLCLSLYQRTERWMCSDNPGVVCMCVCARARVCVCVCARALMCTCSNCNCTYACVGVSLSLSLSLFVVACVYTQTYMHEGAVPCNTYAQFIKYWIYSYAHLWLYVLAVFFYCSSRGGRLFRTAEWAGCGDRRCRRRGGGGGGGRGQTCGLSRQGIVAGIFLLHKHFTNISWTKKILTPFRSSYFYDVIFFTS